MTNTASGRWNELDGERQSLIKRCESYAGFTLPKICLPNGYNQNSDELQHDFQSVGAQAVNHLSNKLMLALFAPSRPFFRLDPSDALKASLSSLKITEDELAARFSIAEHDAVKVLDQRSIRPKLYDAMKHIIITGNALLCLDKQRKGPGMRVLGIKSFVVQRDADGCVLEIVLKETVKCKALKADIRQYLGTQCPTDPNHDVSMYRWIRRREDGDYEMDLWVNDVPIRLLRYQGKWTEEKMPYRPITWDLASGDHYGTGLVEEYAGDFASLSMLSESTIKAAILASEFRWLVNPAGMTNADDFEKSENGAALPGQDGDIHLVSSGTGAVLQSNIAISQEYINRIGRGFLLQSVTTRHAERVTAEEIRMQAEELETGLGGAYSRIAVDVQVPMAYWLMDQNGSPIEGKQVQPTIVTGLAALSRAGDRDNLILFLGDVTTLSQLPPDLRMRLKEGSIISQFAAARGLAATNYLLSDQEYEQVKQADEQRQLQLANAQAQIAANAKAASQGTTA